MGRPREQSIDKCPRLTLFQSVQVPAAVARCPECSARLWVTVQVVDAETGDPMEAQPDCIRDAGKMLHRYFQSDWQPVRDAVDRWVGVVGQ